MFFRGGGVSWIVIPSPKLVKTQKPILSGGGGGLGLSSWVQNWWKPKVSYFQGGGEALGLWSWPRVSYFLFCWGGGLVVVPSFAKCNNIHRLCQVYYILSSKTEHIMVALVELAGAIKIHWTDRLQKNCDELQKIDKKLTHTKTYCTHRNDT